MTYNPLLHTTLHEPRPLSESQQSAITTQSPHIRIIAGAGAGKTETLKRKIVSLLLVDNVERAFIVAFTLTEKAVENLKNHTLVGYLLKIRIFWRKIGLFGAIDERSYKFSLKGIFINRLVEERIEYITRSNHFL